MSCLWRASRRSFLILVFLLVTCLAGAQAYAASSSIPLTVRETAGVARDGEVLRSGVPVARSLGLRDTSGLTIAGPSGSPVPAQFEVTARWNAGKNDTTAPIQWLMVSFPASVAAHGTAAYQLVTDGSAGPNPAPARALSVTRSGDAVTVDTGAAVFRFGSGSGMLFDEVVLDNGTRLIGGGGLSIRANGGDYGHSTTRKVVIEHQGPLSAAVVVQGAYDSPLIGNGQISSRRRYVFTAGSPTVIVRHVANWEGNLGCVGCVTTSTGAPNGVLVERLRDELAVELGGTPTVTAAGSFGASAVTGAVGSAQSAWVRQQLRPSRTSPQAFDVDVAGTTATGVKADGAVLAASGPRGTVAIALNHMHRYEPQALRILPGGSLAIDVVADKAWLANHQGLFGTLAVTATANTSASRAELNRLTWAPLNRPLRAWPTPGAFAASGAVDELPVGPLPANLAGYDTLVTSVLSRTVSKIDSDGLNGLMTFGVYPRYWGKDNETGEVTCGANGDPTPNDDWDDLFWCGAWTDYHNTVSTAQIWAMRTGDVEWLDEIAFPGALRTLHTQILQCSPTEKWFYCGQSPTGYGAYRTDFNSSHAYFENLYLYYWLTGDQTVLDILQRGADSMRRWICPQRGSGPVLQPSAPTGAACAADYPVKVEAGLTGRVAQQWQAAFRFIGHASDDASFLEDFRSGFARAVTQQYASLNRDGKRYGFWGGLVTVPGTNRTDSQWTIGMYDMHYLHQFQQDTGDAAIGIPAMKPSEVIASIARTFKDIEPAVIGDGSVSGLWARLLEYNWSGSRIGGSLNTVAGADRQLYNPEKTGAAEVLIRAGQQTGDAALVDYGRQLTEFMIQEAQRENAPLGKLMGQDLTRLHPAVALLIQEGSTTEPPPPPPPPAAPGLLAARAASMTEVDLTWQDNSTNEDAFRIEQLVDGAFQEIRIVGAGVTSTRVGNLTAATAYSFRVRASNAAGTSGYSNTATATTFAPPPPAEGPAAPTELAGTAAGPGEVVLNWRDNSGDETLFHVERSINGAFQEIQTVAANTTTTTVTGLAAASTHLFRVRASNGGGFSGYSNTASVITLAPNPAPPAPNTPTKLQARTLSSSEIRLTWRDNSSNEAAFHIERRVGSAFQEFLTVGANVTSVTVSGLSPKTSYSFRVRASNSGGFSAYSNTANATTKAGSTAASALTAPSEPKARYLGNGTVQVTWRDNSAGETRFEVERMVNGVYQLAATVGRNATSAKVSGLRSRASYTFRIRVTNGGGQAAYSRPVNVNTF